MTTRVVDHLDEQQAPSFVREQSSVAREHLAGSDFDYGSGRLDLFFGHDCAKPGGNGAFWKISVVIDVHRRAVVKKHTRTRTRSVMADTTAFGWFCTTVTVISFAAKARARVVHFGENASAWNRGKKKRQTNEKQQRRRQYTTNESGEQRETKHNGGDGLSPASQRSSTSSSPTRDTPAVPKQVQALLYIMSPARQGVLFFVFRTPRQGRHVATQGRYKWAYAGKNRLGTAATGRVIPPTVISVSTRSARARRRRSEPGGKVVPT